MPFYTGKSADGSDMVEAAGAYINPDNENEWSSKPYPAQVKVLTLRNAVMDYMNGRFTLKDVYRQIQDKTCPLTVSQRNYVLSFYDENGVFTS